MNVVVVWLFVDEEGRRRKEGLKLWKKGFGLCSRWWNWEGKEVGVGGRRYVGGKRDVSSCF